MNSFNELEKLIEQLEYHSEEIKDKKVIFIGENGHGVSEIQSLNTHIIKHLYENMGFTNIVFESGIGEIALANHYKCSLSSTKLLTHSLYGVWHTHEMLEIFNLIKENNLSMYGMDLQYQNNYFNGYVNSLLDMYDRNLSNEYSYAEQFLDTISMKFLKHNAIKKVKKKLDLIYSNVYKLLKDNQRKIRKEEMFSEETFSLILIAVESRLRYIELLMMNFRMYSYYRDKYMYEHLSHLVNNSSGKFIVFAHNYHVRKNNSISNGWLNEKSLGEFYCEKHTDSYHIGIYMKEGFINNNKGDSVKIRNNNKNSMENELFMNNHDDLYVFKSLSKISRENCFNATLIERESGLDKRKLVPSEQYDAIIGIRKVTPTNFINSSL